MNAGVAADDRFADVERVSGWRIEGRIDEIEALHPRFAPQLLDLIRNQLGVASSVTPTLDVLIRAVHAPVDAAPLGLNRNRRSVALVSPEIDPAMKPW